MGAQYIRGSFTISGDPFIYIKQKSKQIAEGVSASGGEPDYSGQINTILHWYTASFNTKKEAVDYLNKWTAKIEKWKGVVVKINEPLYYLTCTVKFESCMFPARIMPKNNSSKFVAVSSKTRQLVCSGTLQDCKETVNKYIWSLNVDDNDIVYMYSSKSCYMMTKDLKKYKSCSRKSVPGKLIVVPVYEYLYFGLAAM